MELADLVHARGAVRIAAVCLPLLLVASCADPAPDAPAGPADEPAGTADTVASSAEVDRNPLRKAYFGDFHVHTGWSLDAYVLGGDRDGPELAYRFGRGEEVTKADGTVHRLRVPLDFMAVTDHDVGIGEVNLCNDESDAAYDTPTCEQLRANEWFTPRTYEGRGQRPAESAGSARPRWMRATSATSELGHLWHEIQSTADAFYEPGVFTTFPGYEWTTTRVATTCTATSSSGATPCPSGAARPWRWATAPSGSGSGWRRPAPATARWSPSRTTPT